MVEEPITLNKMTRHNNSTRSRQCIKYFMFAYDHIEDEDEDDQRIQLRRQTSPAAWSLTRVKDQKEQPKTQGFFAGALEESARHNSPMQNQIGLEVESVCLRILRHPPDVKD